MRRPRIFLKHWCLTFVNRLCKTVQGCKYLNTITQKQWCTVPSLQQNITCWITVSSLYNRCCCLSRVLMFPLSCPVMSYSVFSWMSGTWSSSWLAVKPCSQITHQCGSKIWRDTSTSIWPRQKRSPLSAAMLTVRQTKTERKILDIQCSFLLLSSFLLVSCSFLYCLFI